MSKLFLLVRVTSSRGFDARLAGKQGDMTDEMRVADHKPRGAARIFARNEVPDTFRISFLANLLVLPVYDDIKRVHGLSRGEYLLLFCLSSVPDLTAQDVADITGRPRNSISRAVHRMLEEGYVTRSPDPDDGRQALLRITRNGQRLHKEIVHRFVVRQEALLGVLSADERADLDRLLGKLIASRFG